MSTATRGTDRFPSARVDSAALIHNLEVARRHAGGEGLWAVVKADAYGHGLIPVARVLAPRVEGLAVARLGEAEALRRAGFDGRILLLEGVFSRRGRSRAAILGLDLVFHDPEQLHLLPVVNRAWLKVDTGMHRLGFAPEAVPEALARLQAGAQGPVGLLSHLADADDPGDPYTRLQVRRFHALAGAGERPLSLANSAGLLGHPDARIGWARPGIMLYGASPFAGETGGDRGLRPVMTLEAPLIAVRHLAAGEPVGYGGTYRCPEAMPVGVVGIGYGDGYPRHVPNGTPVLLDGVEVPLLGRVSMDMLCVDLRPCPGARPGARAVLWGEGLPVERVAAAAGTLAYELLCRVAPRVRREYL